MGQNPRRDLCSKGWGGHGCSKDSPVPILGLAPAVTKQTVPPALELQPSSMGRQWLSRMWQEEVAQKWTPHPSPPEQTPTAPQHCLFSIQLLLPRGPCPGQGTALGDLPTQTFL